MFLLQDVWKATVLHSLLRTMKLLTSQSNYTSVAVDSFSQCKYVFKCLSFYQTAQSWLTHSKSCALIAVFHMLAYFRSTASFICMQSFCVWSDRTAPMVEIALPVISDSVLLHLHSTVSSEVPLALFKQQQQQQLAATATASQALSIQGKWTNWLAAGFLNSLAGNATWQTKPNLCNR